MSNLITLPQAANLIGKNLRTIQRYISSGKLTPRIVDGRNLVDKAEVMSKFHISNEIRKTSLAENNAQTTEPPRTNDINATDNFIGDSHYRDKWESEMKDHAKTREELGVWRGRAESYQNFASKLLAAGDNSVSEVSNNEKPQTTPVRDFWPQEPVRQDNGSLKPVLGYIVLAIVFIGFLILFYFLSVKPGLGF